MLFLHVASFVVRGVAMVAVACDLA